MYDSHVGTISSTLTNYGSYAVLDPAYLLTPGETVGATVLSKDLDGTSLTRKDWSFTVKDNENPPTIITRSPGINEEHIAPTDSIRITFSNDIDPDSTTVSVTGDVQGAVTLTKSWAGDTLTLIHGTPFQLSDRITVSVNAKDQYGDASQYTWSFTIRQETVPPSFTLVVEGYPTNVPTNAPIRLLFPNDIDKTSVEKLLEGSLSGVLSGNWTWSDTTYTYQPDANYQAGETLVLTVSASDIYGNALTDSTVSFSVKPDDVPPSIITRSPGDGEANVSPLTNIVMEFSTDIVRDSTTVTVTSAKQGAVTKTDAWVDYTLTASYSGSFQLGDSLTVSVDAGDAYANRKTSVWTFFITVDTTPPSFTVDIPGNQNLMGTTDFISMIFPGDIDTSGVTAVLASGQTASPVPGSYSWADTVYMFTPSGTGYLLGDQLTLTVNAADTLGNTMAETTHTFTVKADETPPTIVSHAPAAYESNVQIDEHVVMQFSADVNRDSTSVTVTSASRGNISMVKSWSINTLTLLNQNSFQNYETLTVAIDASDSYANRMTYAWTFSTGPDSSFVYYEARVPGSVNQMAMYDAISLVVEDAVDSTTIETSLVGSISGEVSGAWAWEDDSLYVFTTLEGYQPGETLSLTIHAQDLFHNPIPEKVFTFIVGEHNPWLKITSVALADSATQTYRIEYTFGDPDESNTVTRNWQYSVGGGVWTAVQTGDITQNPSRAPGAYSIYWKLPAALIGTYSEQVRFRMEVTDGVYDSGSQVSPLFKVNRNYAPTVTIQSVIPDYTNDVLTVSYIIADIEYNPVTLLFEYSTDGGGSWHLGTPEQNLSAIPAAQYAGLFNWRYGEGMQDGIDYYNVKIRLTPSDYTTNYSVESGAVNVDLNDPPSVTLDDIYTPQSGDIVIDYHVSDAEGDTIQFACSYSLDGGTTWTGTTNVTGTTGILAYDGSIVWQSKKDVPSLTSFSVTFKAIPADHDVGTGDTTGSFQLLNNAPPTVSTSITGTVGNLVTVPYQIADTENDPVSIHLSWSPDGVVWSPATVIGDTLNIPVSGVYNGTLTWNSNTDTGEVYATDMKIRITATDTNNPLGSSSVNSVEGTLVLDNQPPDFLSARGTAGSDTIYVNFNETVTAASALNAANYTLSGGLSPAEVKEITGEYHYLILLAEGEKLPLATIELSGSGIADGFGNTATEAFVSFLPFDSNKPPVVTIESIVGEFSGSVFLSYHVTDLEEDPVTLTPFYSLDGGSTWNSATISGDLVDLGPARYDGTFVWQSKVDADGLDEQNVRFKLLPEDAKQGQESITDVFRIDNNMPPVAALSDTLRANPDSLYSAVIGLPFNLTDAENDTLSLALLFSLDEGVNYQSAAVTGPLADIVPEQYEGALLWNTEIDLPDTLIDVLLKLVPFDHDEGTADSLVIRVDNFGLCRVSLILPDEEMTGDVPVGYLISDPNGLDVILTAEYSIDEGESWLPASTDLGQVPIDSDNYQGSLKWYSGTPLEGYEGDVYFRITPNNGRNGVAGIGTVAVDYNEPPVIALDSFAGELAGDIPVSYRATDNELDRVSIGIAISDDHETWYDASLTGSVTDIPADGSTRLVTWNSAEDLPERDSENIWLRITVADYDEGNTEETGPLHIDNNMPPSVVLSVANPDSAYEGSVDVNYTLADSENNMLSIELSYSIDDGAQFLPASVEGKTTGIFSGNYTSSFRWLIAEDIPDYYGTALVRLVPADRDTGVPDSLAIMCNPFGLCEVALTLPAGEQEGEIQIGYQITDQKSNVVSFVVEYSLNSGETWSSAATEGEITNLAPDHYTGTFTWKAVNDFDGFEGDALLRCTPNNGAPGRPDSGIIAVDYNNPPRMDYMLTSTDKVYAGKVKLSFSAQDMESDTLSVQIEYSSDGGGTYHEATISTVDAVFPGAVTNITWYAFTDLGYVYDHEVFVRILLSDVDEGESYILGPLKIRNLVGDYTFDTKIDGSDLPAFIDAWAAQDTTKEIGPADGTPPNISIMPDGRVDFEDLAVFVWMWNWYTEQLNAAHIAAMKPSRNDENVPLPAGGAALGIIPDGEGRFSVISETGLDFLSLIIESPDGENLGVRVLDDAYWTGDNRGVVLTRSYGNHVSEIVGALLDRDGCDVGQSQRLITLEVPTTAGSLLVTYRMRTAGGRDIRTGSVMIARNELFTVPETFILRQNSPNPFNPSTVITYSLPVDTHARLTVYTITGQVVAVLLDERTVRAGTYSVRWDAPDMPSGLYFYRLETGSFTATKKMLLVK